MNIRVYIYIIHRKTIYIQRPENKTKLLRDWVELNHGVSSVTGYYLHLKSGMHQCSVSKLVFQKDLVSYATLISIDIAYFIFVIIICLLVPGYTEHFVLFHLRQQLISP
jgi:hypothetical protein